jgi:cyclophilin family peptidyl-prolyl cis-trans isomerase
MLNEWRKSTGLETGATKQTGATKAVCIAVLCVMGLGAMLAGGCSGKTCSGYEVPAEKAAQADARAQHVDSQVVCVVMHTTAGDIRLELDRLRAPIGVENFLKYARSGAYNGTIFHRVVPGFVVQGGGYKRDLVEITGDATIKNEWENGLKNVRGSIAWARDEAADTATREFYFNLVDNAKLDIARPDRGGAGYAVFGKVVAGMDVIDGMERRAKEPGGRRKVNEDLQDLPTEIVEVTGVEVCGK